MHEPPMLYFNFYRTDIRKWIPIMIMLAEHGYNVRWWSTQTRIHPNNRPSDHEFENWTSLSDKICDPEDWDVPPVVTIELDEREWGIE